MAMTRLKAEKYTRPLRVVLYVRVSRDKTGGRISVKRQKKELKTFCHSMGWTVVETFCDNSISASYISTAERPEYQRMMEFLRLKETSVDVLAATANTRATRDLEEYLDIRKLCISNNLYYAYNNDIYDMTDTDDRYRSGLDALNAEREVGTNRDNLLTGKEKRAREGYPAGRLLDGYLRIYNERGKFLKQIRDEERAPQIAEGLKRAYQGDTEYSIVADWNAAKFYAPGGKPWTPAQFSRLARNPAYAGFAVWRGEIVGKGRWPALIKPKKWRALQARLSSPDRSCGNDWTIKHLLTGAITTPCGHGVRPQKQRRARHYQCKHDACASAPIPHVDEFVTALLFERFRRPDVLELLVPEHDQAAVDETATELATLEQRLESARESGIAGEVSHEYVAQVERKLTPKIEKLRAQLKAAAPPAIPEPIRRLACPDPAVVWEAMGIMQRREIVRMLLDVRLKKATIRDRKWHPEDRLDIAWKQLP